ncbi:MAG: SDR family oxidoreductase [Planctomycetota bacterium]|jgi:NAD(P)-dependent dehydrogenase (short-subunit alcohol dehydrogenase family)
MKHYVDGKVVVITGGTSGFGLETARNLLEMGARVAITGRNAERLEAAKVDLGAGEDLLGIQADACSTADWKALVAEVTGAWGTIDVLLLNHGAGVKIAKTEEMDDESIQQVLDINIASVIKGAREVIPTMKKAGKGHILTVASVCAYHSWPEWGTYTAAKAGLVGFTKCLHVEMSEWGGKATMFVPGAARTNFCAASDLDDEWQTDLPSAEEFARTLTHCIDVPENTFIQETRIWGTAQVPEMVNPF